MADVESLELQIKGNASGATKSINTLIKTLEKLEKATANGAGLTAVATAMQQLGNSSAQIVSAMQQLGGASAQIASAMQQVANATAQVTAATQQLSNVTAQTATSNNSSSASFAKLAAKAAAAWLTLRKVSKTIASWITESNEYVENLNLFTVSMGQYAGSAQEYAETVGDMMGIDPSTWMRNQGVFMTLATGFGVATDRAATMSQQLTQLGYDISSFYNTSVEDAMQRLQSGISGELEPLRRLGYDLSQAKLEATALSLGIDKTVSSMTQAEKAELRYYAIMTQVTQVQGDMARTLEAPANQMRIFKAQVEQAARALGNIFIPALNAILPYAIAAVKVIRYLADAIARLFGFELTAMESSGLSNVGNDAGNASEEIEKATGSAKKLRKVLLGIDELNVLPDASASGGSGDDVGGGSFDFELPTYDFIKEATNSRVNEIVDGMKKWLGIGGEINSWSDLFSTKLGAILITVGLIGLGFASWKIASVIPGIGEFFKDSKKLASLAGTAKIASSVFLTLAGGITILVSALDALNNGIDWGNLLGMLGGMGLVVGGLAISFGATGAAIGLLVGGLALFVTGIIDAVNGSKSLETALAIITGILAIGGAIAILIGGWIPLAVAAVVAAVAMVVMYWDEIVAWFSDVCAAIGQFFVDLWGDIVSVWNTVATWFDTNVIQPVVNFFVGLWVGISTAASECWNAIVAFFAPAFQWFSSLFSSIWQTISDVFYNIGVIASGCWQIIVAVWSIVSQWFDTTIIQPVSTFFTNLWNGIQTAATNAWNGIKSVYAAVTNWFNTTIIQPVSTFFSNLWSGFINGAKNAWAGVKSVFSTVASFFRSTFQKAWAGIVNVFSTAGQIFVNIKNGILTAFKSIVNGIITGLNKVIAVPFNGINTALNAIKNINILGLTPFAGLRTISVPVIPYLAQGGVVDAGQMFVANEAGPELVGNVGRRTAVMNNDQIVESVSQGVYRAVVQAMSQSGGDQVVEAKVNDKVLFEVVVNRNRQETMRTGYSPLLGGV